MTAPSPTVRQNPGTNGIKMDDGYQTLVTIALDPDIEFWEKTVQPPGVDGGDEIETTTMWNNDWRTMAPRALKTLTPVELTAAWDPDLYNQAILICNKRTTITVLLPDGTTIAFYGYLKKIEPQSQEEGSQPEVNVTIIPTNWDHVANVEAGPVIAETSGT